MYIIKHFKAMVIIKKKLIVNIEFQILYTYIMTPYQIKINVHSYLINKIIDYNLQ